MRRALLIAAVAAWALPARADVPFSTLEVKAGDVVFARLYAVTVLASSDPAIATAEWMAATGELLVTGKAPGRTDVVAMANGRLVGVRILVRAEGHPAPPPAQDPKIVLAAASKACPGLKVSGEGDSAKLETTVGGPPCRKALSTLFAVGPWTVKQTEVTFDSDTLMVQLVEMNAALKAAGVSGLVLHYQGAQLLLSGHLSQADAEKAIVALYHAALGGVPLNDDDLVIGTPEDGGI